MKRIIYNLIIVICLAVGMGFLFYPAASNFWNQYQQNRIIQDYSETVENQSGEELEKIRRKAEQYNRNLLEDEVIIDPFDQVVYKKVNVEYYETLNPQNNGVMGRVRIPAIDVSLPIYHGTSEEVLQKAVGHLEQTSLPVGGEGTHAVLSGHRGLSSAELFTNLDQVKEGDVFYLDILGETLAYQVDKIRVVEPHQLEDLAIISGEDHVTLVTCTPYSINSHRLLVRGSRIPYEEIKEEKKQEVQEETGYDIKPYIAAGLAAVLILIVFMIRRKNGRRT